MRHLGAIAGLGILTALPAGPARAQSVSFSKDIVPIFREACIKCHSSRQAQGGLSLASFASLEKGGKGGRVLAAKADESRLYRFLTGALQPKMPIGGSLTKPQMEKVRSWLDQGAKPDVPADQVVLPDSAVPPVKVPKIPVKVPVLPEVTALAWSRDGKILAVGTYLAVRLIDPANGRTIRELAGHADKVHCLRFSPDGKLLAASGGPPSLQGEIKIWEVESGKELRTISGHNDFVYSCSWSPDGRHIASASYDKLIKIWEVATGNEVKTLKDHADAVYAVAYNSAGNLLASGSADRSVKVWEVASGKRIYTLAGHTDAVFDLAWNAQGNQLTSVGGDRTVRTWNVNPQAGQQARNVTAHEKTVNTVVYSNDGGMMATASDDQTAKVWNAGNGATVQTIKPEAGALLSVAFSPDAKQVAVGGFDGSLRIYTVADGKVAATLIELPKPPEPKPAPAKPAPKPPAPKPAAKTAAAS